MWKNPTPKDKMIANARKKMDKYLLFIGVYDISKHNIYTFALLQPYTDEDLQWDKPPTEVCLLIHLSVTLHLNLYLDARREGV